MSTEKDNKSYSGIRTITIDVAIEEIKTFCCALQWVEYETVIGFLCGYFDILGKSQHQSFRDEVMKTLEFHFKWKVPYPSDLIRINNELERRVSAHGRMRMEREGKTVVFRSVLQTNSTNRPLPNSAPNIADEMVSISATETTDRSALIENTIDEYLEAFKGNVIETKDYTEALYILKSFFTGASPVVATSIFVRYGYKKKLGHALGSIYRSLSRKPLSLEYLNLSIQLFDCYKGEKIEEIDVSKSNLHKYFTSKTQ